jgi:hypothetical protein
MRYYLIRKGGGYEKDRVFASLENEYEYEKTIYKPLLCGIIKLVKNINKIITCFIYKINKPKFDKINRGAQWSNIL